MRAKSIKGSSPEELSSTLEKSLSDGFSPTLAIVFISVKHDRKAVAGMLGPMVTAENERLAEVWKSPMAGFFTYGEYGRALDRSQEFHSGACCCVALKEKQ